MKTTSALFAASLLFLLLLSPAVLAQTPGPAAHPPTAATGSDTAGIAAAPAPVPVPEPTEKAMRYYRGNLALWGVRAAWELVVPAALLFTGFSAVLRNWAQRLGRKWFFVVGIYFALFAATMWLIGLPLDYYQGFVREHAFDISNQTFGKWFGDSAKGLLVAIIAGILVLWLPYRLLRKCPRSWWLISGLLAVPLIVVMLLVQPVWIDPLFNQFGAMQDKALERDILALAERAGIEGSRVFEVNKSVDTTGVNAYVTGFLDTKRIVLWDTIIAKLNREELLFVMGHEMGHYVLGHVWQLILVMSLVILATLYAIHRAAQAIIARFHARFGFAELHDVASLPLLLLFFQLSMLVLLPPINAFSRHLEHESDRFGLEITRDNHAAATAFVKLQQQNLGNPRPGLLYTLWQASHPALAERIEFCNTYHPWTAGEASKYAGRFHEVK